MYASDPPPVLSAARLQEPWPPGESLGAKVILLKPCKRCAAFAVPFEFEDWDRLRSVRLTYLDIQVSE